MNLGKCLLSAVAAIALPLVSVQASTLYWEDFDVDNSANWTVNDPADTDIIADFNYDYSAIGVPAAPGSSTTTGLKMTANNTDGVFGGFSVSPTGQSFSGDYRVSFNLWQNYAGPVGPGGSGTTQLSMMGIGTSGTVGVTPGSSPKESVMFAVTLDGGSSSDYRVYSSEFPFSHQLGDAVYLAPGGAKNNSDAYYAGFGGESAPADQLTLFPGQTGATDLGEIAFAWREVTIDVVGGVATWSVDGLPISSIDTSGLTLGGGNILFGHADTNGSSSSDPNDYLLNVTLIDNVVVTAIPEPASLAFLATAGLIVIGRRKRC